MYPGQIKKRNTAGYLGVGIFVLMVIWGTLMLFDIVGAMFVTASPQAPIEITNQPALKSNPKDVLFTEAYETSEGSEIRYAYMTDEPEVVMDEDVTRRTPNSRTEVVGVEITGNEKIETLKTSFYAAPQFYEDNGQWRQIEYATTTPEDFAASGAVKYVQRREWWERLLPGQPLFAQTSTFRPDPNVEVSSVDGWVSYTVVDDANLEGACDTSRNSTTGGLYNDSATTLVVDLDQTAVDNAPMIENLGEDEFTCIIGRVFLLFDSASLPDNATISSSLVRIYVTAKAGSSGIVLVSSNPASNTGLANADYNDVGSTAYASSIAMSSITTGTYNTFTLNSTGIANVSLTGVTKMALRMGDELSSNFSIIISGSDDHRLTVSSADTSGTSQDPELQVTYTVGSFSFGQWFPF